MKSAAKLLLCFLVVASTILVTGVSNSEATTTFKDIGTDHRAYKEITYLAQGKIVNGDAKGYYNPKSKVTRAEFTALLGRALGLDGTQKKTKFKDVGVNNFASGYIHSAVQNNIISGYKDGSFKPNGYVTRGEMAIIISRAFNYSFDNTASGAAQAIMSRSIDTRLDDGTFGTNREALREETAIYLARAINYTLRLNPTTTFNSTKYVTIDSLNMRKGPSTNFDIVGKLKKNDRVAVAYTVGNWSLVKTSKNIVGFVSTTYLSSKSGGGPVTGGDDGSEAGKNALTSQTLVIDPGHGGTDPGAAGFGLREKDVVLDVSLKLKALLAQTPLTVIYTRTTDSYPTLSERTKIANNANADTFVSVHANAANGKASGTETWYYDPNAPIRYKKSSNRAVDSKKLAEFIQARLHVSLNTKNRKVKPDQEFAVLNSTKMPAVLAELGFIDNKEDNAKLASPAYRQKAAEAIYLGLLDYYKYKGFDVASLYNIVN
ncbi:N-acetylmuramoyl-L-alanine amidase [Bacillus sp. JJ722]|uniref:N-acetylmuramoyl-L-alanine amidase n=1 Tax=Bacillus sp. JJ722 TaxID=3122973 RepID=UPI002FFD7C33